MSLDYDALAFDYHWLVGDAILSGESFLARHRPLLDSFSLSTRILDCACGIGSAAIGLARRGYRVTAADAGASKVAEAERRARAAAWTLTLRLANGQMVVFAIHRDSNGRDTDWYEIEGRRRD